MERKTVNEIIRSVVGYDVYGIYGEAGVGKTCFVFDLMQKLKVEGWKIAYLEEQYKDTYSIIDAVEKQLFPELAVVPDVSNAFRGVLDTVDLSKYAVIIDNADMYDEMLKEIYLMLHQAYPLLLVLVGREQLQEKIVKNNLEVKFQEIYPLTAKETKAYIDDFMRVVGFPKDKISPFSDCIKEIHEVTRGIPFRINIVCETLLEIAYNRGVKIVSKDMVREAAKQVAFNNNIKN